MRLSSDKAGASTSLPGFWPRPSSGWASPAYSPGRPEPMTPPIWRDERGRCRPRRHCPRCGVEIPVLRLRVEDVHRVGGQLYVPAQYVEWCGHGQEVIPIP
jgi:hypothetical protein